MGDQLCALKTAYLFVEHAPPDVDKVIMSVSPGNEMHFLWEKFIEKHNVQLVHDTWNAGDWPTRWSAWDKWRQERSINGISFHHYRELYLRIHGAQRQNILCGSERGLGRRNIYQYWYCGQEHRPEELPRETDWFDNTLIHHPSPLTPTRDVYISPHAKTQGNHTFTFGFWAEVVHLLIDAGITVTVGYNAGFCEDLNHNPLYRKFWGSHRDWMEEVCRHKIVACGNTGTGWLACACGVPMITMEPPNSQMPDHRYRECGLRNIVEVVDTPDSSYVARRLIEQVRQKVVMTTGCYDVLHAGHVRHLERSRALGTKLVVALNSDASVRSLKGDERPINPQRHRKVVLEALRCVDEVRVFDGRDARDLIREVRPDVLTCGYGYTTDLVVGRDLVESYGGKVVITCTSDASDEPSTTRIVQRMQNVRRAANVVDACRAGAPYSVNPFDKLKLVADLFMTCIDLPGDVADLGAYTGGMSLVLHRLASDKHLHIFDTWNGNPYDDPLCHHKSGEWKAELEGCKRVVGTGDTIHYHQGVFPNYFANCKPDEACTTRTAEDKTYCFVYVDMDTEQATKDAIAFFWPRMVQSGKIVFDDFGWLPCAGVEKAVREAFTEEQLHVCKDLHTCWVEKP